MTSPPASPSSPSLPPGRSPVRRSLRTAIARSRALAKGAVLLCATTGAHCAGGGPPPRYPIRDPARILAVLRAREARIPFLHASGSADQFGRQGRVRGSVDVYVRAPDQMRVDASAFGHVVSSMVANSREFTLLQGRQYIVGPPRACVAAQLVGIALDAPQVAAILMGGAPLLSAQVSAPRWENGAYVVDVAGANGASERLELELPDAQRALPPEQQEPRVKKVVLRDRQGVRAEITYNSYRVVRGVAFPDRVRVVMPRDNLDTELRFDQVEPSYTVPANPDDPEAAPQDPFNRAPPEGAEVSRIEC